MTQTKTTASDATQTRARFEAALDRLIKQVKEDQHILAAVLCGSLSHDEVWDKSDIDLCLICTDDRKTKGYDVALVEDNINIHTTITPRTDFKKLVEGAQRNSFRHSVFAKSKLLFTKDPTLEGIYSEIQKIGARDTNVQLLRSGSGVVGNLYKAKKWFQLRGDLELTSLWLLYAANPLAQIEAGLAGEIIGREVIQQGLRLNPDLFQIVYVDLLNKKKTKMCVTLALQTVETYLERKAGRVFKLVFDYLEAEGDVRSTTDIEHFFTRNYDVGATMACEYLSDIGMIDKTSVPARLTTQSQLEVDELAFFYDGDDLG
jgi:predicted nucleotidyltransferase